MALGFGKWRGAMLRASASRHWGRLTDRLRKEGHLPRSIRDEAQWLHRELSTLLQISDPDSTRARTELAALPLLPATDWRWRPEAFTGRIVPHGSVRPQPGQELGHGLEIWHNCPHRAISVRQIRNRRADDLASYGLRLDVLGFAGEYVSLSIDFPDSVLDGIGRHHIICMKARLTAEEPVTALGRINLVQGPNIENMLRQMGEPITSEISERTVEFDLSFIDLARRPVGKVWIDLIFSSPRMNAVSLNDIVLLRYPRAEI